jgi:hypothetical protein
MRHEEDGKMGGWEDGKMGGWEDGKMGGWERSGSPECPFMLQWICNPQVKVYQRIANPLELIHFSHFSHSSHFSSL